jgi:dolichol-phosphate mannosyltransferase
MKLTIITPAYNEEGTIEEAVRGALDAPLVVDGVEIDREVIVVDDGSTDRTRELAGAIGDRRVKVLRHDVNKGKGASIRTALEAATGEITIVHDADLEYDPNDFEALITPIARGEAEVVYGSRFYLGYPEGMRFWNYLANRLLRDLANFLYWGGITDEATCYKAFRTELLRSLKLRCNRFEFCPEVTAKTLRRRIKIREVPISYQARGKETGKKIGWRDGFIAAWTLLKYRFWP